MIAKVEKQPKSQIKLSVKVESDKVKETYEKLFDQLVQNAEIPGFRKGMAPRDMVKEKTDVSKLYGEVINTLLQTYYPQVLKEQHINPISNPKVEIEEFDLEKDFEFTAIVAVRPEVKVGDYQKKLKELQKQKEQEAKDENAKKLAAGEKMEDVHIHLTANEVIDIITETSEVEVPELLIEDEVERMMSRLVDQAQTIGLSLDQYLKAQNKTSDQLKVDYSNIAEKNLKAEFVMGDLVKKGKIEVTDEEIDEMAKATGDEQMTEQLKDPIQRWYIKSILEKNKLLTKLIEEASGHEH